MNTLPAWHYNEFKHVGVDYADPAHAAQYDETFFRFRGDPNAGNEALLDELGVTEGTRFIDLGCGTGDLAIQAAQRGAVVYAVDVSAAMLGRAKQKAAAAGVGGITFCEAGFLTYEHVGEAADVVYSCAALHHLPDFWKQIGLQRTAGLLKDDGIFFLADSVYSFDPQDFAHVIEKNVAEITLKAGAAFGDEVAIAHREEFGTFAWIMEGLLTHAGFDIEQAMYPVQTWARYRCRKRGQPCHL